MCTLTGHRSYGKVVSAAFSPDGSRVVSGSTDQLVILWDARTGALVSTAVGFQMETLIICKLGFNQNYHTSALILLIKIVLCSEFH